MRKPRQCIKKQRYHFADKGPYSQGYDLFHSRMLIPDILECEVKWALGSITTNKASGELFQILKDDAIKVLHSICQQIWKT